MSSRSVGRGAKSTRTKQMLAIVGAFLLFVGVFLPIVSMPIVGSLNYFHNGQGDGTIVLVLAVISIILAVTQKFRGLWVTGLCSIGLMLFALVTFLMRISEIREQMQAQLADNPFRGLADVAMNSVQLQWGWAVLILGGVLIIVAAAMRGPVPPDVQRASGVGTTAKWGGATVGIFLLLLGLASLLKTRQAVEPSASVQKTASEPSAGSSVEPTTNDSEWVLNDFKDEMDNTPIVILTKSGTGGTSLVIRCAKHKTDAYVDTDTIVDNGGVRIKLDQAPPVRQSWARSISFDVSNLGPKLQRISEVCGWAGIDESRARAKAANAALRARLTQYVHPCAETPDIQEVLGKRWCWSDSDGNLGDQGFAKTREKALDDAVEVARTGLAFKRN